MRIWLSDLRWGGYRSGRRKRPAPAAFCTVERAGSGIFAVVKRGCCKEPGGGDTTLAAPRKWNPDLKHFRSPRTRTLLPYGRCTDKLNHVVVGHFLPSTGDHTVHLHRFFALISWRQEISPAIPKRIVPVDYNDLFPARLSFGSGRNQRSLIDPAFIPSFRRMSMATSGSSQACQWRSG